MQITVVGASIALAVLFGAAGTVNTLYLAPARKEGQHFHMPPELSRFVGLCQLAAATGLIGGLCWRPLGVAAAAGLMLLMVGAVIMHRRVGDSMESMLPGLVVFGMAGFVFGAQLTILAG
ncbi:DoxX family protein [Mycobacterium sp. pUA109]|uniref:DoxX family protein n=1 Tax=Mycobacterium sp. pUA109 TaxID=3238982 RepID=UPI00351B6D1E